MAELQQRALWLGRAVGAGVNGWVVLPSGYSTNVAMKTHHLFGANHQKSSINGYKWAIFYGFHSYVR